MKKLAAWVLAVCLTLVAVIAVAQEDTQIKTIGDWTYVVQEDGTASIQKWEGKAKTLVVPDTLDGFLVTNIGNYAFASCTKLMSITLPESLNGIGDYAFHFCFGLTSITLPDSVTKIGANPFFGCISLTNIVLSPDHPALTCIDGVLLSKADKRLVWYPMTAPLGSYAVAQGVASIGDSAFSCCNNIISITLPDGLTSIGNYAFDCCAGLTSITLPQSVTSIGNYAFDCCAGLTSISLPQSVTNIGNYAFYSCEGLTSMTLPSSVTAIGNSAFSECPNLTLTVPRDSYAARYANEKGIPYTYPDSNAE